MPDAFTPPNGVGRCRTFSLFTQIIANAVVEAESETGLKIIETLSEDDVPDSAPPVVIPEEEEVEVDPTTYVAEPEAKAEEAAAAPATDEASIEEDKFYTK